MKSESLTLRERNCLATYAELVLAGPQLVPAAVTAALAPRDALAQSGLHPHLTSGLHLTEWERAFFSPAFDQARVNVWRISTLSLPEQAGDSLARHLSALLDWAEPRRVDLTRIIDSTPAQLWVDCYWAASGSPAGPSVPAALLTGIGRLGAHLSIQFTQAGARAQRHELDRGRAERARREPRRRG